MQMTIKAEAKMPLCDIPHSIQEPLPKQGGRPRNYETKLLVDAFVRNVVRQSGDSVLVVACETGIHWVVFRAFLEGKAAMTEGIVERLAKHDHVQPAKLATATAG